MVIYGGQKRFPPVSSECSPVPDGKRFAFLCGVYCNSEQAVMQVVSVKEVTQILGRCKQRVTAIFFLHFLAVFSGFLSILIPFLTSCGLSFPCVPHLSVAFYVVKGKASPEQFQRGFAVFLASLFSTR